MPKSESNPKIEAYFRNAKKWREELATLRAIVLDCKLTEELKWRIPCYTFQKSNVVLIAGFKDYCGVGFFKGALLKDPDGLLRKPGQHTQSGRVMRFNSVPEIIANESVVRAYIHEAIEVEQAGLKAVKKQTAEYAVPEEFQATLKKIPAVKTAFENLTPGRQRAYIYYFSQAKQSKTREARIEKYLPNILDGKGLDDK